MKKLFFITTTVLMFTIIKVNAQSYYNTTAKPSVYCFAYASTTAPKILYITPPELSSRFFNKARIPGEELKNEFENSLKIEVGDKFMDYYGQMVWKACTSQDFTFYGDSFQTESDAKSSIKKVMAQFKVNGYEIRTLSL
jgi:hypothetical protein